MNPSDIVQAAGVLILTRSEPRQFLLMRHPDRWDLPKGHADLGESLRETALREMEEETGLAPQCVQLDPGFEYSIEYSVQYREETTERQKRVTYFIGWVDMPGNIECTEHDEARWFPWEPPHQIQSQTIDPLLQSVAAYLEEGTKESV